MSRLVRSVVIQGFQELVAELGGNPAHVIQQSQLTPDLLKDPNARIEAVEVVKILNLSAEESN